MTYREEETLLTVDTSVNIKILDHKVGKIFYTSLYFYKKEEFNMHYISQRLEKCVMWGFARGEEVGR